MSKFNPPIGEYWKLVFLVKGIIREEYEKFEKELTTNDCDVNPLSPRWMGEAANRVLHALKDKGKITWEGLEK